MNNDELANISFLVYHCRSSFGHAISCARHRLAYMGLAKSLNPSTDTERYLSFDVGMAIKRQGRPIVVIRRR